MSETATTPEDRRTHLGFIEDAISRMASEANSLKAWLAPVATASYGYAVVNESWKVALLGVVASVALGWQAASYLRQERAFRVLYDRTVQGETSAYSMDIREFLGSWFQRRSAILSWSVLGYFGIFALTGLLIMVLV